MSIEVATMPDASSEIASENSEFTEKDDTTVVEMKVDDESVDENSMKRSPEGSLEDQPPVKKHLAEDEKLWKDLNDNPRDFQLWTSLLQLVDQEVFSRGLQAIPLSTDLWIHYLDYIAWLHSEDENYVRKEFERAIEICGLEFRSDKLWETYINWESSFSRWKSVTCLYERLLTVPTLKFTQHWQKFQDHVKKHQPSEVVELEELKSLYKKNNSDLNKNGNTNSPIEICSENDVITKSDEDASSLRKKIVEMRHRIYETMAIEANTRWGYEDAIKRPYFHVKPLEKSQLVAWRVYLDFEISQGDKKRTKILFERCLIACALYEEFWQKYIRYLEEVNTTEDEIRDVYSRACNTHLIDKIRIHLWWAAFEETKGHSKASLSILRSIQARAEDNIECYLQEISLHRRSGDLDSAEKTFMLALEKFKQREDKAIYSYLAVKYARFTSLSNPNILLCLADLCLMTKPPRIMDAAEFIKKGTCISLPPGTRLVFAHRYLNFLTECGLKSSSISDGMKVLHEVQADLREHENIMADDCMVLEEYSTEDDLKKAKVEYSAVNGSGQETTTAQDYAYQNYSLYSQAYSQAYGTAAYQGWTYPTTQQAYDYSQAWSNYASYYGQR